MQLGGHCLGSARGTVLECYFRLKCFADEGLDPERYSSRIARKHASRVWTWEDGGGGYERGRDGSGLSQRKSAQRACVAGSVSK